MFIMRKDIFFRYCDWLFPILEESEKRIDVLYYNVEELRVIGLLGERCLGIFFTHLNRNENIKAAFFHRLLIQNPDIGAGIYPRFKDKTAIVTASNNYFIPYAAVMLQSLLDHISTQRNYEIYILHTDVAAENQIKIKNLCKNHPNISIEFYNMMPEISMFSFGLSEYTEHISVETFFRTFVHKVFCNYDRVLYLDSDLIIMADVTELLETDIGNNLVGACIDGEFIGNYFSNSE
jgi:hypothetical protein